MVLTVTKLFKLTVGRLLVGSVALCSQFSPAEQKKHCPKERLVITENCNGETVRVAIGQTVLIELPAQIGTGYSWHLNALDSKIAVLQGAPKLKSRSPSVPGVAERQVFRFLIQDAGVTTIRLEYVRPWVKDVPARKTFQITIQAYAY